MIIVDTSAWIYLFDKRRGGDEARMAHHFYLHNKELLVITDLIVEETHKWLTHHAFPRNKAQRILEELIDQNFTKIIPVEDVDRMNAAIFCKKYLDHGLSYTDAITVAIMKRLKVKEVFSFDTDFDLFPGIIRVPHS